MTKENSARAVPESELDELKQQAMEIALRVHVIQGGNLLNDVRPENPVETPKFSKLTSLHKIMVLSILMGPIVLLYSMVLKNNIVVFFSYIGILTAMLIYSRLSKKYIKK